MRGLVLVPKLLTQSLLYIDTNYLYADQGEANSHDPANYYGCQLEAMIEEWRSESVFNNSRLPFFVVQLAPYYEPPCSSGHKPCGIGTNYP